MFRVNIPKVGGSATAYLGTKLPDDVPLSLNQREMLLPNSFQPAEKLGLGAVKTYRDVYALF